MKLVWKLFIWQFFFIIQSSFTVPAASICYPYVSISLKAKPFFQVI